MQEIRMMVQWKTIWKIVLQFSEIIEINCKSVSWDVWSEHIPVQVQSWSPLLSKRNRLLDSRQKREFYCLQQPKIWMRVVHLFCEEDGIKLWYHPLDDYVDSRRNCRVLRCAAPMRFVQAELAQIAGWPHFHHRQAWKQRRLRSEKVLEMMLFGIETTKNKRKLS